MIFVSILVLLLSNAVTLRQDMSINFNRIAIIDLIYCILHDTMSLSFVNKGIGLHGGLLFISNITLFFHIFIFFIAILILQLTAFYPRVLLKQSFFTEKFNSQRFLAFRTKIFNKMGEHMKIIEYPKQLIS
jgi:NADH-ubiquinone oxidoreductase chain 2